MRPTIYFPELRLGKAFVPAHAASDFDMSSRVIERGISARAKLRVENAETPFIRRRRPALESTVIEA